LKYKNLTLDFFQNNTFFSTPEHLGQKMDMKGRMFSANYIVNVAKKAVLHTKLSYNTQTPYDMTDVSWRLITVGRLNTQDVQWRGSAYIVYQPFKKLTISTGTEVFKDKSSYAQGRFTFNRSASTTVRYDNIGVFGEANLKTKFANITVGARADRYGTIPPVLVPRIAITKAFKKLHFKGLYTEAFKTPTVLNIELERPLQPIKPERFRLIEFEAGAKVGKVLQITANVYDILVKDYITRNELNVTKADIDYTNIGNISTRGLEAEAKYLNPNNTFSVQAAYSYYKIMENQALLSLVGLRQMLPGTPTHKAVMQVFIKPFKKLQINVMAMHLSNKFRGSALNSKLAQEFTDEQHINLYTQYNEIFSKSFSIGFGCYNLLDKKHWLISTKKDYISEIYIPTQGREFYLRLIYNIKS
jgi:outer membrane receptor protein involved in Fe transport